MDMNRRTMGSVAGLAGLCVILSGAVSSSWNVPESVELRRLSEYYDGVVFDHEGHLDLAESCGTCHHHTTGEAPESRFCATCHHEGDPATTVLCAECHRVEPFSAAHMAEMERGEQWFHVDKPGLKGAYHRNCLGCHQREGAPTGCEDCHARNAAGDALFQAGAGGTTQAAGLHH